MGPRSRMKLIGPALGARMDRSASRHVRARWSEGTPRGWCWFEGQSGQFGSGQFGGHRLILGAWFVAAGEPALTASGQESLPLLETSKNTAASRTRALIANW